MAEDVCRLCLGTNDLMWLFDDKMAKNMSKIVEVTSGVLISRTDEVSQMVCCTCSQITIKMFKFRTTSIKNDKQLKENLTAYNAQLKNSTVTSLEKEVLTSNNTNTPNLPSNININPGLTVKIIPNIKQVPKKFQSVHPSVKEILKKYPCIKLPQISSNSHFGPYITLLSDEVDDWYKEKNFSDKDIKRIKKEAFEYSQDRQDREDSPVIQTRKRKRRISSDSVSSTGSKTSNLDENTSKCKQIKPNNEVILKDVTVNVEALDATANSHLKPKDNESPSIIASSNKIELRSGRNKSHPIISQDVNKPRTRTTIAKMSEHEAKPETTTQNKRLGTESFSDLLPKKKVTKETAITLRSLLEGDNNTSASAITNKKTQKEKGQKPAEQSDIIEIEDDNDKSQEQPCAEIHPITKGQDFSLFTSRPFLESSKSFKHREVDGCLILSDSDEDSNHSANPTKSKENDTTNVVSEVSPKSAPKLTNKSEFVKSLGLAPKEATNTPDFSLLSLTEKTNTLYACTVCDAHCNSLKELKTHKKRMHTRCPFCNRRFRNLACRDEHIKNDCVVSHAHLNLKNPMLVLVRVEEIPEIKQKYSSAFEILESKESSKEVAETESSSSSRTTPSIEGNISPQTVMFSAVRSAKAAEKVDNSKQCDAETENAVKELENLLQNTSECQNAVISKTPTSSNGDIICISDDEEDAVTNTGDFKRTIKITRNNLLRNINIHDDDNTIITRLLVEKKIRERQRNEVHELRDNPIVDGGTSKVKIFKNLRKHLKYSKIPVDLTFGNSLKVGYKYIKTPCDRRQLRTLWTGKTMIDIKLPSDGRRRAPSSIHETSANILKSQLTQPTGITSKVIKPNLNNQNHVPTATVLQPNLNQVDLAHLNRNQPNQIPTSHSLVLTTTGPVMNSPQINFSTTPLILNNNSTTNNVTNFVLLSNQMITTSGTAVIPAAQGPLPIIQCVTTAQEDHITSATVLPVVNSSQSVQPTIRVRNLSELS